LIIIATITTFHVPLAQRMTDPFQEAEYSVFDYFQHAEYDFKTPVLIHGGIDVVPSRIAAAACPTDHQLICVRSVNVFVQFLTVLLYLVVLLMFAGLGTWSSIIACAPALALLLFGNGLITNIVEADQGAPSVRDLIVMAGLLVMTFLSVRVEHAKRWERSVLLFVLGLLVGLNLFWSYNRGLMLFVVSLLFVTFLSWIGGSISPVVLLAFGAISGVLSAISFFGIQILKGTLFDIVYWSKNANIWHTPIHKGLVLLVTMLLCAALWGSAQQIKRSLASGLYGPPLMLSALGVLSLLSFQQSINRSDIVHMRWVLWPVSIVLAYLVRCWLAQRRDVSMPLGFALLGTAAMWHYHSDSTFRGVITGLYENSKLLAAPIPNDRTLAGGDLDEAADIIAETGGCTFAADNTGIIYLLSRVPPCSRFAFGAYIAVDKQREVIASLKAAKPIVILWSASGWWSKIDGRSFADRAPVLAHWIEANFPEHLQVGQEVLVSHEKLKRLAPGENRSSVQTIR
jgi:hypothetical protein